MVRKFIAACFCGALLSCAPMPTVEELDQQYFGEFESGRTSRADVIMQWGLPTATFENDRILTYRMAIFRGGELGVVPRLGERVYRHAYHLVLVFDEKGLLTRYKLLRQ